MQTFFEPPFQEGSRLRSLYLIFLKHANKLNPKFVPDEEWAIQEVEKWKTVLINNQQKGAQ